MRRTILHPRSLEPIAPVGYRKNGRPIWPILGGSEPPNQPPADPPNDPPPNDPPADPDKGFPENTSVAEMTDKQQAAYWKYQSRKHENTVKARSDYDDLKTKAAEADRLRQERETENEKAIREAREQAAADERQRLAPSLVQSEFRAAAKGVLTAEQTAALIEDLDLTKYLTATGEVDTAKVEKKVTAFAPNGQQQGGGRQDLGQGRRDGNGKPSVAAGADMFAARRKPAGTNA
jgi:hypothetical protein